MADGAAVCQVAFSVLDPARTVAWYREVLGFVAGGGQADQGGPEAAAMQGLPACRCDMAWLVDRQDFFQLEFFRYYEPAPAARRPDPRPSDLGWAAVGLWVADFDQVLRGLERAGTPPVSAVTGTAPRRRVCVRDPEGVLLELLEEDIRRPGAALPSVIRPGTPVATRFARLVVAEIAPVAEFFAGPLGLAPAALDLHDATHEALWLGERPRQTLTLWAGDFLVELVEFEESRPKPGNYLISDQGLVNIAIGSRSVADFDRLVSAVDETATLHGQLHIGSAVARYLSTPDGTSVELLAIPDPAIERAAGFLPLDGTT